MTFLFCFKSFEPSFDRLSFLIGVVQVSSSAAVPASLAKLPWWQRTLNPPLMLGSRPLSRATPGDEADHRTELLP